MKRIAQALFALALVTSLAGAASAHPGTPGIDRREVRQNLRIRQGVRSGDLTRREAARLHQGERRVHRIERRAMRDGTLTQRERCRVHRSLDRESRRIHRLRHNGRPA